MLHQQTEGKRQGRPSSYTKAKADQICRLMAEGKSLREICRADGMPGMSSVWRWLEAHESFRKQYAQARERQAEALFAEMLAIADTPMVGTVETSKEWGTEIKSADMIEHRRLQIETRKWMLGKLKPKVYGAAVDGEEGDTVPTPVQVTVVVQDARKPGAEGA